MDLSLRNETGGEAEYININYQFDLVSTYDVTNGPDSLKEVVITINGEIAMEWNSADQTPICNATSCKSFRIQVLHN